MNNADGRVFSVGHSNHEPGRFVALLREAGITAVADVRSQPYSRRLPQFSRPELEPLLRAHAIAYVFLGDHLGGRPGRPSLYDADGRADYERVRATAEFRNGLDLLCRAAGEHRIAMLCGEEDPLDCHRGLMITPALVEREVWPGHLRKDGRVESTAAMEDRLLAVTGVGAGIVDGLFAALVSPEERDRLLAEAYRVQARRKAFRMQQVEKESGTINDDSW